MGVLDVFSCCCSVQVLMVELVFFLYKTGESMLDATTRPYIVKVVCHNRFPENASLCHNLDQYPDLEDDVQGDAGIYLMYYRILVNLPAIFLGLFCGAWSDKYGRKVPMMLPGLGSVFSVLLYMLSLACEKWTLGMILVGALVQGLFGKSSVITMAVNSYASDISDKHDRTQKLGKLLAMNFFGLFAGALLSGIFQDMSDLPATFCVVVFIHGVAIVITVAFMPETIPLPATHTDKSERKSICLLENIKESMTVLTQRRLQNGRQLIIVLFLVSVVNQTCKVGETDVTLLFVTRSPLSWPKSWYGYLLSIDYAVMGVALLLLLPILSNVMKLPDVSIIIIGIMCKIVRLLWAGFCVESWMVYTSVVIGSLSGLIMSAVRSLMSKTVHEFELGKTFSLLASGETASKLLGTVIFLFLYGATAHYFPGFAFLTEAAVYIVMLIVMLWMHSELSSLGQYDLLQAVADSNVYGADASYDADTKGNCGPLGVIDELEEDPTIPQPLSATTP